MPSVEFAFAITPLILLVAICIAALYEVWRR